jgi:hypothetical protein
MLVTVFGISMEVRVLQSANASSRIVVRELGCVNVTINGTDKKAPHKANVYSFIIVIPDEIVMLSK